MTRGFKTLGVTAALICLYEAALSPAWQVKSVSPDPDHEIIELENDQVRVIRVKIPARAKSQLHAHSNRVVIPLSVQHSRATTSNGSIAERHRRPGQVFWAPADVHMTENLSDVPIETLIVEVKTRR